MPPKRLKPEDVEPARALFTDMAVEAGRDTRWQPGQTGNARGRPKEPEGLDEMLAFQATKNGVAKKLANALLGIALEGSGHVQLAAIQYVYDRLEGKPRQSVPEKTDAQEPIVLIFQKLLSDEHALAGRTAPRPTALPSGPVDAPAIHEAGGGGAQP